MTICNVCGADIPEGASACTCGAPVPAEAVPETAPAPMAETVPAPAAEAASPEADASEERAPVLQDAPASEPAVSLPAAQAAPSAATGSAAAPNAAPVYRPDPKPDKKSRWATVSLGGWIGILILMAIPVVNIILVIVWSCGGCQKQVKTNFARAILILALVTAILYVAAAIVMIANPYLIARIGEYFGDILMRLF